MTSATGASSDEAPDSYTATNADRDADEITQEEKPRSRIIAEYLAHGYVVGDAAIQRAVDLDHQHGVSTRFFNKLTELDSKYHATDRAKTADQSYGITQRASTIFSGLNSYFEKATNTPTGKKLVDFCKFSYPYAGRSIHHPGFPIYIYIYLYGMLTVIVTQTPRARSSSRTFTQRPAAWPNSRRRSTAVPPTKPRALSVSLAQRSPSPRPHPPVPPLQQLLVPRRPPKRLNPQSLPRVASVSRNLLRFPPRSLVKIYGRSAVSKESYAFRGMIHYDWAWKMACLHDCDDPGLT